MIHSKPLIIGITGGIGSGKSTLSKMLKEIGYQVFDTDDSGRKLQENNAEVIRKIKDIFGENIYEDGQLKRKDIASQVFVHPELLRKLSDVIHPAVKAEALEWIKNNQDSDMIFIECAILFEGGFDKLTQKNIVVTADRDIRIQRIIERDGLTEKQIRERMHNQLDEMTFIQMADYVIHTDKSDLDIQVPKLLETIKKGLQD